MNEQRTSEGPTADPSTDGTLDPVKVDEVPLTVIITNTFVFFYNASATKHYTCLMYSVFTVILSLSSSLSISLVGSQQPIGASLWTETIVTV